MIYDKKANISRYYGMFQNLDAALRFIENTDLNNLPKGRITIDGDNVFVNHFSYETAPKTSESLFEDHSEYLDLHFPLSGHEIIAVSEPGVLKETEKRPDEDSTMYVGDAQVTLPVTSADFLIVYPGEVHLPKLMDAQTSAVDKLVFKIRL